MKSRNHRWRRILATSGTLLLLSGCPLTDQQITTIAQSAISTGLNALVTNILNGFLNPSGTNATTNTTP